MGDHIFPDKWWTLSKELYDECRNSLKALLRPDLEDPTKDVSLSLIDYLGRVF